MSTYCIASFNEHVGWNGVKVAGAARGRDEFGHAWANKRVNMVMDMPVNGYTIGGIERLRLCQSNETYPGIISKRLSLLFVGVGYRLSQQRGFVG